MYVKSILVMAALLVRFRNGWTLVQNMRAGRPCDEAMLWDGTRIAHPEGRAGLLEALLEVWLDQVYTTGFYRPGDRDVIVDAGANVGVFAISMARQNRLCRVIALEPFAENFKYLQKNVRHACPETITCREVALGAGFGKGQMQATGSRSLDHVLEVNLALAEGTPVIPLAGLFSLIEAGPPGIGEIDFLKVDIEGSERDAFAGASPEVLSRFKRIAMEYHDRIVPGTLDLLRRVLTPTHEITIRPSKMEGCGILLARRRDVA
jgi:FkbM family methyltransferase